MEKRDTSLFLTLPACRQAGGNENRIDKNREVSLRKLKRGELPLKQNVRYVNFG